MSVWGGWKRLREVAVAMYVIINRLIIAFLNHQLLMLDVCLLHILSLTVLSTPRC